MYVCMYVSIYLSIYLSRAAVDFVRTMNLLRSGQQLQPNPVWSATLRKWILHFLAEQSVMY